MSRETDFLNKKVKKYLDGVKADNKKHWKKLIEMIYKLGRHGREMISIDSESYKPLTIDDNYLQKLDLIIIQLKIKRKKYRIHTALTDNYLYLVHGFDKQSNKTPQKEIDITIKRSKKITNF